MLLDPPEGLMSIDKTAPLMAHHPHEGCDDD